MSKKNIKKFALILCALILIFPLFLTLIACSGESETIVNHYKISAVYDEQNQSVSASEEVTYINATSTTLDEICFNLFPSAFRQNARFKPYDEQNQSKIYPNGISYGGIDILSVKLNGEKAKYEICGDDENILSVKLPSELFPDESVKISVDFNLKIPTAKHRFSVYNGIVNLGNWYPIVCAYDNGFIAEPYYAIGDPFVSEVADYSVEMSVKKGLTVVGSAVGKVVECDSVDKFVFNGKNLRDFALSIGEFSEKSTAYKNKKISYYYPKNQSDERDESALSTALDAIKTFENSFGEYNYESYTLVRTNFYHGGMEYPAFAMISSDLNPSLFSESVIHETAHQWWYGAVGSNQIKHAYLDEGLAEYSTTLFYEKNPRYGVLASKRIADAIASYMLYFDQSLSHKHSEVMERALYDYASETEYAFCSYLKGQLMLADLRKIVGETNFFNSLKTYYRENRNKIALPDNLVSAFEKNCNRNLKSYFDAWVSGKAQTYI